MRTKLLGLFSGFPTHHFPDAIAEVLRRELPRRERLVFLSADPENFPQNDDDSDGMHEMFAERGMAFRAHTVIDRRTGAAEAAGLQEEADCVFLMGGDPMLQMELIRDLGLAPALRESRAVILGVSAGAMNLGRWVTDVWETRSFYEGLGLTEITVKGHDAEDAWFLPVLMELSAVRPILAMEDESAIFLKADRVWKIGKMRQIDKGAITVVNHMEGNRMDKKARIEKLAREAYEKCGFNGTWLYAENGEIISKGAYGFRDAEDRLPMEEDSIFEMASITKMFTATAVMLLVREGKLRLDDEYAQYFPEYPYPGVTVRHLLTHTSGMPDDFETENWVAPVLEKEHRIPACGEILRFIVESGEKASHAPGETFRYTDVGYCLLANLVEQASGVRFEDFLKKNIFEPGGMKDSGIFHTRRDGRPSDRFTRNMVLEDGKLVPSDLSKYDAGYVVGSDGLNGCDYLYTTIFDMLAWDRALREEKVLTLEEQRIMFTPGQLNSGDPAGADDEEDGDDGYGFGWCVKNDPKFGLTVNHSGGMPGLETWFEHFVDADRTLVILNCRDWVDGRAYDSFFKGMRAAARDEEPEPIRTVEELAVPEPDKSNWERFCGKYDYTAWDFAIDEVFIRDGALYVNLSYKGGSHAYKLYPLEDGSFGMKPFTSSITFSEGTLSLWGETGHKL